MMMMTMMMKMKMNKKTRKTNMKTARQSTMRNSHETQLLQNNFILNAEKFHKRGGRRNILLKIVYIHFIKT